MTEIQKITQSKYFKTILIALSCIIFGVLVFAIGVRVGERRARYSYQWGANYERNFMGGYGERMPDGGREQFGPSGGPIGMARNFEGQNFRNGHGVAGIVTSIIDDKIIIKDRSGKENTVAVKEKTLIKDGQADLEITDLENGENLVIIGNPSDNGVIDADLIRVFNKR